MGKKLTSAKAKKILEDNSAQGHPLTEKQKRYFGWIAGGMKPRANPASPRGKSGVFSARGKVGIS